MRKIIIPEGIKPYPSEVEVRTAKIIAQYFNYPVEFIAPGNGYKQKTPDITVSGVDWEIKTPRGSSLKTTIRGLVKRGAKQSNNLIINGSYSKMDDVTILNRINVEIQRNSKLRRILYISKENAVIKVLFKK